ncbi:MAG: TetR/AcrR family transcriptional regulator [Clostridia bacterium]|nr:TetR/AcrR family transcriptional regulator [Clostridia bacterium]
MPPKVKTSRDDIITAALELIRKEGEQGLNARAIATALGCSTQPIYFNFDSMDTLKGEVRKQAEGIYEAFVQKETEKGKYSDYEAKQIAYIRFANKEKHLFKLLFLCDHDSPEESAEALAENARVIREETGISPTDAFYFHLEMQSCVHGIATMLATNQLSWDGKIVSKLLSDVQQGLLTKYGDGEGIQ